MAELQRVESIACEEGEDAVEAGDLVDGEDEGDELGGGGEGDDVEEGLPDVSVSIIGACRLLTYSRSRKLKNGRHDG